LALLVLSKTTLFPLVFRKNLGRERFLLSFPRIIRKPAGMTTFYSGIFQPGRKAWWRVLNAVFHRQHLYDFIHLMSALIKSF
jgi:hypothetical protein